MRRRTLPTAIAALLAAFACIPLDGAGGTTGRISIPVRFHVVGNMAMSKRGVSLDGWMTARDIRSVLLPEANRIWRQADIEWTLAAVDFRPLEPSRLRDRTVEYLLAAGRDADGRADPMRIRKLDKLLDTASSDGAAIDVYVVPYLGERSQGNASRKKKRVFLSQWTDKPSRGREPPEKFGLVEQEPFANGSLGRTLAHELGHVLGLRHPEKKTQVVFGRLMGGKRAGYTLTDEEIDLARANARRRFATAAKHSSTSTAR
jgi:hypothetical protein